MPPLSNIQSIITYFQNYPPDGLVSTGDIWYNPDSREAFIYIDEVWHNVEITPITPGHMYGYSIGGRVTSVATSLVDRIEFPFDSGTAVHVGNTAYRKENQNSGCNSSEHGFNFGGEAGSGTARSYIERITFPFASGSASSVGRLSGTRRRVTGFNDSTYGYAAGGSPSGTSSSSGPSRWPGKLP